MVGRPRWSFSSSLLARWQPLDRWVAGVSLVCCLMIGILLVNRYVTPPQVRQFNWQQQRVTAQDQRLVLRFNRIMDGDSITKNLRIDPPLTGISRTVGQRWIYTLSQPAQYGQVYQLRLEGAVDSQGDPMTAPFVGEFRTPDRQVLTVGVDGPERGRLVWINLEVGSRLAVSPQGLRVTQFIPSSDGEGVYFLATTGTPQEQDLYYLTLSTQSSERLLDHSGYQNLRFRMAPGGDLVVVERFQLQGGATQGVQLWVKPSGGSRFRPLDLDTSVAGDFVITPDENSLLMAQGQGIAVVPLSRDAITDTFLAQYGQALAIRSDGTQAAMVQFNPDFSRSLWVVSHLGNEAKVLTVEGSVLAAQFSAADTVVFVLATELDPDTFAESPVLMALNWRTGQQIPVVRAEFPTEIDFAVAPDGRSLIYSLMQPSPGIPAANTPISATGQSIAAAQLWQLDLSRIRDWRQDPPLPQPLNIAGVGVAWIP